MTVSIEIVKAFIGQLERVSDLVNDKVTCACNRDLTEDELRTIIIYLRKNDLIKKNGKTQKRHGELWSQYNDPDSDGIEIQDRIFFKGGTELKIKDEPAADREPLVNTMIPSSEATIKNFAENLNEVFNLYEINTCLRKCHFLAQIYHESSRFTRTYEGKPKKSYVGGIFYRGRGFIQLTGLNMYKELLTFINGAVPTDAEVKIFAPTIAQSMYLSSYASARFWDSKGINLVVDDDNTEANGESTKAHEVSKKINRYETKDVLALRKTYTNEIKRLFDFSTCPKQIEP